MKHPFSATLGQLNTGRGVTDGVMEDAANVGVWDIGCTGLLVQA